MEEPAERVAVVGARLRDHATAILTLDDGRQLLVDLTGLREHSGPKPPLLDTDSELWSRLMEAADALAAHGMPGAADSAMLSDTGLVPRDWSDTVARMSGNSFIWWKVGAGHSYPGTSTTRPLSPSEAVASYGNRADTSDADYVLCRDNAAAIVAALPASVQYGIGIPTVLAQMAAA